MFLIYDLDGTVIDSSHRHLSKPDGSIDLAHWFENCTPEKVAQDTLLPLAVKMQRDIASGKRVLICTARTMQRHDFDYLETHGLATTTLCRAEGCMLGDADHKERQLDEYFQSIGYDGLDSVNAVMYEDNMSVIERLSKRGVACVYVGEK